MHLTVVATLGGVDPCSAGH